MNRNNRLSTLQKDVGTGIDSLIQIVDSVVSYSRQKALYEADCRVREAAQRVREAVYAADSARCQVATVDLAILKFKLKILRGKIDKIPSSSRLYFDPLVAELENRIMGVRRKRLESAT